MFVIDIKKIMIGYIQPEIIKEFSLKYTQRKIN